MRTLSDVRAYIIAMDEERMAGASWQDIGRRLLAAAEGGDVDALALPLGRHLGKKLSP
jgi:hypothetical protein